MNTCKLFTEQMVKNIKLRTEGWKNNWASMVTVLVFAEAHFLSLSLSLCLSLSFVLSVQTVNCSRTLCSLGKLNDHLSIFKTNIPSHYQLLRNLKIERKLKNIYYNVT